MLVVVLTDEAGQMAAPRAVGPFENWDAAQACANDLLKQWELEEGNAPTATIVNVEEPASSASVISEV